MTQVEDAIAAFLAAAPHSWSETQSLIIPEAKAYFADLPIPDDLLAKVERLHQSSGLDGGPRYIEHLFPFWDPGAGDGPVPVTAKAVADLDLLPNLTRIRGLENSKPNRTLLAALKARGIALMAEDQADA